MNTVKLGDVCEVNPRIDSDIDRTRQCSFVPMEVIDDRFGIIIRKDIRVVREVEQGYTFFKDKDIIIAKITPCMENGKAAIARNLTNGIGFGSTEFHVIRAVGEIIPEWIFYYIRQQSVRDYAESRMTGSAGQKRVPVNVIEDLEIPLPAKDEQKRIVGILEHADKLRRQRRYAQELSERFLQSVFTEMFGDVLRNDKGWTSIDIESLCELIVDCPHSTPRYSNKKTLYPCIRTSDIQNGYLDWSTTKYVEKAEYDARITRHKPSYNDVLYTREGERFGFAARTPANINLCLGQRMMLLKPSPDMATSEFLWAMMNSAGIYWQASTIVGGSTSPHVNVGDIKAFKAIAPPLDIQAKFSQIVQKQDHLHSQQQEASRHAEQLLETLLCQAFEGDI